VVSVVSVVAAHHERATVRIGDDTFVKIDAEDWRIEREAAALSLVPPSAAPRPEVRWRRPNVLALAALPGSSLAKLGEASSASPAAWRTAGAVARRIHALPIPPWTAWDHDGFRAYLDGEARWLVDHGVASAEVIARLVALAEPALRPFPMVFTHGDLQSAHVLVDGDGVTGVVDWADACAGDALFDLAVLTVGHPEHLDDVVAGYGDAVDRDVIRAWWALRKVASVRWMVQHDFDAGGDIAELHHFAAES
jgi:Ser/Thr protein kinase RdoA (MazF antagonist)